MTRDDLAQRISDQVAKVPPVVYSTQHMLAIAQAIRTALAGLVTPDPDGRHFPGLVIHRDHLKGRLRQPTASASVSGSAAGGICIRIDSDQDAEFWVELVLSADLLSRLGFLRLVDDD